MALLDTSSIYGITRGGNDAARLSSDLMQRAIKNRQDAQEAPLNTAYKQAQIKDLQRAQTIMPYLIQKYQDEHNQNMSKAKIQKLYENVIQDAMRPDNQGDQSAPSQPVANPNVSELPPQDQSNINKMQPGQSYVVGSGQQPQPVDLSANQDQGQNQPQAQQAPQQPIPAKQAIASANAAMPEQVANNPNGQTNQSTPVQPQQPSVGQEQVIRQGNPKWSKLDEIAGKPGSPIPAPKIVNLKNGEVQTEYPSGKITRMQTADSLYQAKKDLPVFVMQKNLYANNIDKTLKSINLDDLTYYNGPGGKFELSAQEALDAAGMKTSDKYQKYKQAEGKFDFLSRQVRQFYGDSIQPSAMDKLEKELDPRGVFKSARTGKLSFNSKKDLLQQELQTYRDAAKDSSVYTGKNPNQENKGVKKSWKIDENGNLI